MKNLYDSVFDALRFWSAFLGVIMLLTLGLSVVVQAHGVIGWSLGGYLGNSLFVAACRFKLGREQYWDTSGMMPCETFFWLFGWLPTFIAIALWDGKLPLRFKRRMR